MLYDKERRAPVMVSDLNDFIQFLQKDKEVIRWISLNVIWYFTAHEANNTKEFGKKKQALRYGFKGNFDVFDEKCTVTFRLVFRKSFA